MKLAEYMQAQAKKVGFVIPEGTQFPEVDIPDAVATGIDNGLISIADAKNNHPEIKNHYFTSAMNGADAVIKEILEANPELNEDADLAAEKSTFKRIKLVANKVAELNAKKLNATTSKDKQTIQAEIDKLQSDIRTEKAARQADEQKHIGALKEYKRNTQLSALTGARKTIHDTLPGKVRNTIINSLIGEELAAAGAQFDLDENEQLVIRRADGTNYYGANNTVVTPDAFIDTVLAKHKQLITTGQPAAPGNTPPAPGQQANFIPAGNTNVQGAATLRSLNAQARADFEKGSQEHRQFAG